MSNEVKLQPTSSIKTKTVTDKDVLKQEYEFLPNKTHEAKPSSLSTSSSAISNLPSTVPSSSSATSHSDDYSKKLVNQYNQHLYKEYAVVDLSRYKEGKYGLRWRTEKEVITGKGQYLCGGLLCDESYGLHSYEVPFQYIEKNIRKEALVKVRLCGNCATKMFYKKVQSVPKHNNEDEQSSSTSSNFSQHHHHHHSLYHTNIETKQQNTRTSKSTNNAQRSSSRSRSPIHKSAKK